MAEDQNDAHGTGGNFVTGTYRRNKSKFNWGLIVVVLIVAFVAYGYVN